MSSRKNIGATAATFARQAQSQFAEMAKSLQAAAQSLAGLTRSLRVPVPQGGSRSIRGSRQRLSIFESAGINSVGGYLSREIVSGGGDLFGDISGGGDFLDLFDTASSDSGSSIGSGSFLPSQNQLAGQMFDASQRAQRIR